VRFFGNPAFHILVAVLHTAVTAEGFVANPGPHAGKRNGNLVSRAGRVGADGAVHERVCFILVDLAPLRSRDGGNENIWIIRGNGGHGEDVAIPRIHHHSGSATDDTQGLLDDVLDFRINGEIGIITLHGLATADLALNDAFGIPLQDAGSGFAFELVVEKKLKLGFSFDVGFVKLKSRRSGSLSSSCGEPT
jgi:hypothetical protein